MKAILLAAGIAVASAGSASASLIDIDFETGFAGNETVVGDPWSFGGVTFTRGEEQTVVKTGSPQDGFVPNDNIVGGMFGDYFLTDDFKNNTTVNLTLDFDGPGVTGLSFAIGDIDGTGNGTETFKATATLLGGGTSVLSFTSGDAGTGDSIATTFDFGSDLISSVFIEGTSKGGSRNIGWGIDNISASVVPLPAGMILTLTALGGLGALRARRRVS